MVGLLSQLLRARAAPVAVLVVVSATLLVCNLEAYPRLWFDEGYKLNAARTLAEQGVYGTFTVDGLKPFDPGISSGPADIVPVAISFSLFQVGIAQARSVPVLYSLVAIGMLYLLAARLFGRPAGFFAACFALGLPALGETGLLLVGRQVLGEAPALALILCGLALWFSTWERPSVALGLGAGLLLGLGLLSKTQIGIALVPALVATLLVRACYDRRRLLREAIPVVVMPAVVVLWSLLGQLVTAPAVRADNGALLADAIATNLITGLWGRTLSRTSLAITLIMAAAVALSGLRLWRLRAAYGTTGWGVGFTLTSFVALYAAWFACLSVGWPRYAFAGLVVAQVLLGGQLAATLEASRLGVRGGRFVLLAVCVCLLAWQGSALGRAPGGAAAERVAALIDREVPPEAVVETWEWELSALSAHTRYHHPDQRYLFLAIRQFSHERTGFDLGYDPLQADPDFVVIGAFGHWTRIYQAPSVAEQFCLVATVDDYRLYRRRDASGSGSSCGVT